MISVGGQGTGIEIMTAILLGDALSLVGMCCVVFACRCKRLQLRVAGSTGRVTDYLEGKSLKLLL